MHRTSHNRWAVLLTLMLGLLFISPLPSRVHSQASSQLVESDDSRVLQAGTWSSQAAPTASNHSYLFSSGNRADVLTFAFDGTGIEILYVAGPSLGTLAIEIDGTVLRTIITTAKQPAYHQSSRINYLSASGHTLQIYAPAGDVIAIDAFVVASGQDGGGTVNVGYSTNEPRFNACAPDNVIHRVNLTSTGAESSGSVDSPRLSYDGRYVVFDSYAPLMPADTDSFSDIYLYDRQSCALELLSVSTAGVKGDQYSLQPEMSADARYVTFLSAATNLVADDTNGREDVFWRDRQTNTTLRVSIATNGDQITLYGTSNPTISANGRYVAFDTTASTLVPDDTNGVSDVFIRDTQTNTTTRVSLANSGAQATSESFRPAISGDGRYVAFVSLANNLVPVDTNSSGDIFVRDTQANTTTRVSVASGGIQATGGSADAPIFSTDGRYVAFYSGATNLVAGDTNAQGDLFVHDRQTNTTTRESVATGGGQSPEGGYLVNMSADGRYFGFVSNSSTLVPNDTNHTSDTFVHDRLTNTTIRADVDANGIEAIGGGYEMGFSGDGRYVAFTSGSANLVGGDLNNASDVFVTRTSGPQPSTLALFRPSLNAGSFINTLQDIPAVANYDSYTLVAPGSITGAWVMGDWDGDGDKTPGLYATNGVFYTTNGTGAIGSTWTATWIGLFGRPPVAGHFDLATYHDCIGVVDSANFPPYGTAFALYFTCNLAGGAPALTLQWLSVVLPNSTGATGTHQFAAGDFDGNGVDSIAIRRGALVAWTNVPPTTLLSEFSLAQYWGVPPVTGNEEGVFVVGDFQPDSISSFGVMYQNGNFYYRNDLAWNSGVHILQRVGAPIGTPITATTWR